MITTVMVPIICRRLEETEVSELDAMRAALLSHSQPLRTPIRGHSAFPKGMLILIKAAAGDGATIAILVEALGHDEKTLQEAASFYLQQQLIASKSNPFRCLGLTDQATQDDIVLHKRWLLKWLHPDRNPNKWQSAMFNTITDAANAASAAVTAMTDVSAKAALIASEVATSTASALALNAASRAASTRSSASRHRTGRGVARKRVRVIHWRDMLRRIARRAAVVAAIASLGYFGASQFLGGATNWSVASQGFWSR